MGLEQQLGGFMMRNTKKFHLLMFVVYAALFCRLDLGMDPVGCLVCPLVGAYWFHERIDRAFWRMNGWAQDFFERVGVA